jgi:hypothetical protein
MGSEAHPAAYPMSMWGGSFFLRVKQPEYEASYLHKMLQSLLCEALPHIPDIPLGCSTLSLLFMHEALLSSYG